MIVFLGLLSKRYTGGSGFNALPFTSTLSSMVTLKPISVTKFPFTVTSPLAMRSSASRLEHRPDWAMNLFSRNCSPFLGIERRLIVSYPL